MKKPGDRFGKPAEKESRKMRDLIIDPAIGSGVAGSGIAELELEEKSATPWGLIIVVAVIVIFAIIMVVRISGKKRSVKDKDREEDK